MRPAAFRRGAMRNATSPELKGRAPPTCATSSSARSPGFTGARKASSPSLAKTRFSPVSGTASATVAIATTFMNEVSIRDWSGVASRRSIKACASLKATPAPHSALQG